MALTYWDANHADSPGNLNPFTQYYETDRQIVIQQAGVVSVGLVNFKFRNDDLTVFAARNDNNEIFGLVALPCPPYHHLTKPEAIPGNILTNTD